MKLNLRSLILILILLLCGTALLGESFGERTANQLREFGISPWIIVVLISMLPIVELRGAIPVAIWVLGFDWPEAVLLSVAGNILPIPLVLLLLDWGIAMVRRFKWGMRFTDWLFARTRNKGKVVERYEELGLIVFVGIPLPGTGAWTGALAAKIFGLSFWKSLLCAFLGVILAAVLVTLISVGIPAILV